jgi:hypothetical protein
MMTRSLVQIIWKARLPAAWLLAMLATTGQGCDDDDDGSPVTQLTVRLHASQEVTDQMAALRVKVIAAGREGAPESREFKKNEITKWPVDIQVVPKGKGDTSETIEVVAMVLSAEGSPVVEQRMLTSTVPYQQRVLDVILERCGNRALGTICESNPNCRRDECLSCVDGSCSKVPSRPGTELGQLKRNEPPGNMAREPMDGGMLDAGPRSPDAGQGPLWCADHQYWQPVFASGQVPAGIPAFAMPMLTPSDSPAAVGARNQFICRVTGAGGGHINGKANGKLDGLLDYGCYFVLFTPERLWHGAGLDQNGDTFDLLSPPDICKLRWAPSKADRPLPANALVVTRDGVFRPQYACRVEVNDQNSVGMHIGRVNQNLGDKCRVQYFGGMIERDAYEVLVQDFPLP